MNISTKANYVFEVTSKEFQSILRALSKHNPDLYKSLKEKRQKSIERLFKMLIETEEAEDKNER